MKQNIILVFVALVAFTWSCQKEALEDFSQNLKSSLKSDATEPIGELVDVPPGQGGNVECDQVAELFNIDFVDSSDRIGFDNDATDPWYTGDGEDRIYYPEYPFPGLTVTVTGDTYVSWSYNPEPYQDEDGWWINLVGAVIVKGGNNANVYLYNTDENVEWVHSDSGLSAPDNLNNPNNIPYGLSNLTFCFIRIPYTPPTCYEFMGETAWAANDNNPGELRYTRRGNWATYVEYAAKTTTLFAGQNIPVGTVDFSAVVDGEVTITITLEDEWIFAEYEMGVAVEENVKIQDYEFAPSGNPAPGQFEWKGTAEGKNFSIVVPANYFYGVHVDVGHWVEVDCPEED